MKSLLTTALFSLSLLTASPGWTHALGQPPLPVAAPARTGVRPLVRYLAAVLRLTPTQATAVQQALRNRPAGSLAPEGLVVSLNPVLDPEAQQRLLALQNDASTYRALYYLAARH